MSAADVHRPAHDTAHDTADLGAIWERAAARRVRALALLGAGAAVVALMSLASGPVPISLGDVGGFAWAFLTGAPLEGAAAQKAAVFSAIRLPRLVVGFAAGAALAVAGAVLQGLFRNPLADPGLIGVSAGAAFAVAATIVLGGVVAPGLIGALGLYALPLAAFAGSLGAMAAVLRIARQDGFVVVATMLLAGVAINALAGAAIGFLTFLSDDAQLRTLTFWTLGSFAQATWATAVPPVVLMGGAVVFLLRRMAALNALALGEREALHLGIDIHRLKRELVVVSALAVGAAVSITGIVGFIGLVVPHLVRLVFGADHRIVLPASALLGAALVVAADTVARTIVAPAELPVGVLTSAIGGPFFLWLLTRQRGHG